MTKPKRVRWDCPDGKHPGVLGPSKPRRDSIVRYCLPCSEESGRLVERVAPAVDRQRQASAERSAEKAKAKRQRDAAKRRARQEREDARYVVDGLDLKAEMRRLVKLRTFGGSQGRMAKRPPELHVRQCQRKPSSVYGRAWWHENRISVSTWPGQSLHDLQETLLHELVHIYTRTDEVGKAHGDKFFETMDKAFMEAYGLRPKGFRFNRYHGRYAAALADTARS